MEIVVCEDRAKVNHPGTVIEGVGSASEAQRKGNIALPYHLGISRSLANCAYVQSFYGKGWMFSRNAGERGCPNILQLDRTAHYIYWAARVEPLEPGGQPVGSLRLVNGTGSAQNMSVGMRQVSHAASINRPGVYFGKSLFSAGMQGLLFVELYAVARFKVMWFAMTQHAEDFDAHAPVYDEV